MSMDNEQFQCWLAGIDSLSAAQRREAEAVFSGRTGSGSSLAAVELAVDADRHCPHCGKPGAVSRGKARGVNGGAILGHGSGGIVLSRAA